MKSRLRTRAARWLRGLPMAASLALGLAVQPACAAPAVARADPAALRAEAFEAAQWAVRSDAAEALAKLSVRFAKGADAIAGLTAQRDALTAHRDAVERRLEQLYGSTDANSSRDRAQARTDYDQTQASLDALDKTIEASFPAYAELTNPKAASLAQTQDLLKPNEGLIFILVNPEATYVWGVTHDQSVWARADDLGEKPLSDAVSRLRQQLHAASLAAATPQGQDGIGAERYDVALAYSLYDRLIRPVEGVFKGKTTLISVTTGPLSALPLAALPTDPPGAGGDSDAALRSLHWMIDRYALATLPAVSSLKTLRCDLVVPADRASGCPPSSAASRVSGAQDRLSLVGFGAPALDPRPSGVNAADRSADVPAAALFDGAHADRDKLMQMGELAGAKQELDALRVRFSDAVVREGADATETAVKTTDSAALARARFVIFSTHGVLAGADVSADGGKSLAEPGLVFTPPPTPSDLDDGYLSASEAAQLHLSADFVVLSACNTATGEGKADGDGLSTLARSFFYAGARSLLVSHWEVSDRSTSDLITQTFASLEDSGGKGRAEALRQAMLKVRAEPGFGHPYFWAPFALVGEPDQ